MAPTCDYAQTIPDHPWDWNTVTHLPQLFAQLHVTIPVPWMVWIGLGLLILLLDGLTSLFSVFVASHRPQICGCHGIRGSAVAFPGPVRWNRRTEPTRDVMSICRQGK